MRGMSQYPIDASCGVLVAGVGQSGDWVYSFIQETGCMKITATNTRGTRPDKAKVSHWATSATVPGSEQHVASKKPVARKKTANVASGNA
eukprot:6280063-Amphidinium_carterae.1